MKSRPFFSTGFALSAVTLFASFAQAQAQSAPSSTLPPGAPLFDDGRMLRPLVQDVLQGSALVDRCDAVAEEPLALACHFGGSGQTMAVDLKPLLARVKAPLADPRSEILSFANAVLIKGDPDRVFPQRANLRPVIRGAADVARAREEERLPGNALFPVPGFPAAVAFAVRDDATTVHLIRQADDPLLGYSSFQSIMKRAQANAAWTDGAQARLRCRVDQAQGYCRVVLDGFYETSMLLDTGFAAWLALRVGEPSLIAIPSRDELLVARLSDRQALADLDRRLKQARTSAITRAVAYWDGSADGDLQAVEKWALRGGMLLPARLTVRLGDGSVISSGF